jgi:LIVCS family branched-chain amino acid:cation transporter
LGLLVSAVIVPFLGLVSVILFEGNYQAYFNRLGKVTAFLLIAGILMLIGPFGVVPRCITVAYGGCHLLCPSLQLGLFSFVFCTIIGCLVWSKNQVVDIIGLLLTPFKLGGIIILIVFGLWCAQPSSEKSITDDRTFMNALLTGYQMMDLMAAFFFSSTIVAYLRNRISINDTPQTLMKKSIGASVIGALLLCVVYVGFVSLGAKYAPFLLDAKPEHLLVAIGGHALGYFAKPVIAIVLAVGCLATAIILTTLFVDFLQNDVTRQKLTRPQAIFITAGITFVVSLMGFEKIMSFLGGILEIVYPALIGLAVMNLLSKLVKTGRISATQTQWVFWTILLSSIMLKAIE